MFGSFFGTTPIGEIRKLWKGGKEKGPAIRPSTISLNTFFTSGKRCTDFKFSTTVQPGPEKTRRGKPHGKPSINKSAFSLFGYRSNQGAHASQPHWRAGFLEKYPAKTAEPSSGNILPSDGAPHKLSIRAHTCMLH